MKKVYSFHILGLNLKNSYQIISLFDMYIDMGERIAGKQDMPSPIFEYPSGPPNNPKYKKKKHFGSYEKQVFKLFPLVVHMSPL